MNHGGRLGCGFGDVGGAEAALGTALHPSKDS